METVQWLVEFKQMDINVVSLGYIWTGCFELQGLIKRLLKFGLDEVNGLGWTALNLTAFYGNYEIVKFLGEKATTIHIANNGWTTLHFTITGSTIFRNDHYKTVKWLMDEMITDINCVTNYSKFTPLHIVAISGELEIVKWLYDRNADVGLKTQDGFTAIKLAEWHKMGHVVTWLSENFPDGMPDILQDCG